jgi:hypothetical protein
MGELRTAYKISVRKPKGREYFLDLDIIEYKTEMGLREVECDDVDWIHLIWDSIY